MQTGYPPRAAWEGPSLPPSSELPARPSPVLNVITPKLKSTPPRSHETGADASVQYEMFPVDTLGRR